MFQNCRTIIMAESSVTSLLSVKPEKNECSMLKCYVVLEIMDSR